MSLAAVSVNLLAIETSCDETAAALVAETGDASRPWRIRSSIVASQSDIHREWGGVVPELASRQHVRDICGVVEAALAQAGAQAGDVDAVAVTQGPGLVGSLLVGITFAKTFAWGRSIPVIPVHHLAGHIESLTQAHGELPMPAVVLVVSGGHTSLYLVPEPGVYRLVGRTRDDAAGEAYDKVAKLLGLGYPGGPVIDRLAREGREDRFNFPVTRLTHADRNAPRATGVDLLPAAVARRTDFSFSGLKTAVLREVEGYRQRNEPIPVDGLAAAFEEAVVDALARKTVAAATDHGVAAVALGGGVAANRALRSTLRERLESHGLPLLVPPPAWCTDNGAMIGAAAGYRFAAGDRGGDALEAIPNLALPWLAA
jgi:N6-L-threonylcarbamoyladenine synthase